MKSTENQIEQINQILPLLNETLLNEVKDFTHYLLEKQKRHEAFVEGVMRAEKEKPIRFDSVDDAVKAVFDGSTD